jgi:hypothetical protein
MSYYEKWFAALEKRLVAYGFITREELEGGKAAPGSVKATPLFTAEMARKFNRGLPSSKDPSVAPRFRLGEAVRTQKHQSDRPHAPAALRTRKNRPWGSPFPRYQLAVSEAAACVLCALCGARALG